MIATTFIFVALNVAFGWFSLWVAFAKVNRPITWGKFYFNLGAAAINFLAVFINLYNLYRYLSV